MSNPMYPGMPPASNRPSTVTTASYLLYLVALLLLVGGALNVLQLRAVTDAIAAATLGHRWEELEQAFLGLMIISAAIYLLFAVCFVLLGVFNSLGRNGSRVTTWVIGGIGVCCCGAGILINATGSLASYTVEGDAEARATAELRNLIESAVPGWINPTMIAVSALTFIALCAALILLALQPSNEYFRRLPAWAQPAYGPYPGGAYPPAYGPNPYAQQSYPPQPPDPAQPAAPQPPAYDPYAQQSYPPPVDPFAAPPAAPPSSGPPSSGPPSSGPPSSGPPSSGPPSSAPPSYDPLAPPSLPPSDPDRPPSDPSAPPQP